MSYFVNGKSDVFEKMTEETILLTQDGYLKVDTNVKDIIYHPTLNVILICTNNGFVKVLDVITGVILQSTDLSAINRYGVKCKYIPKEDRMLFCDGQAIGARSDYNGVLLLDSILQKTLSDESGQITLELPLSEAIILKESLSESNIADVENIISNLDLGIQNVKKLQKKGIKAQKWNIPCFTFPVDKIKSAISKLFNEFTLKKIQTAELQVVSAIQERISELLGEKTNSEDKKMMASEVRRRETFSHWPHMDYKWALPEQMAQAGFYHNPNTSGEDRALCFTCNVCLVSWERTDEPWNEHERHSPVCPFVIGEFTQNVPTSVTYATAPALDATFRGSDINLLGTSNISKFLPTCTKDGLISVFDVSGKIKRTHSFFVTQFDSHILDKFMQDFGQDGIWNDENKKKCSVDKKVTALCIMNGKTSTGSDEKTSKPIRPALICGISISKKKNSRELESLKSLTNLQAETLEHLSQYGVDVENELKIASRNTCIYLVVYDFMYRKEEEQLKIDVCDSKNESFASVEMHPDPAPQDDTNQCYILLSNNCPSTQFSYVDFDTEIAKSKPFEMCKKYLTDDSNTLFIPPPPPPLISKELSDMKHICWTNGPNSKIYMNLHDVDASTSTLDSKMSTERTKSQKSATSISSHIIDVQNNPSEKKLNYSKAVQCIGLPEQYKTIDGLEILNITPTQDENHILVTLCSQLTHKSCLLIYELDFVNGQMVKIKEQPVIMREMLNFEFPLKVELLPPLDKITSENEDNNGVEGNVVLVCIDGGVRVVELATLKTIRYAKIDTEKFIAATYCNSLDRLCAATTDGSLNFFALNESDNESIEEHDDDDSFLLNMDSSYKESTSFENMDINRNFKEPPYVIPVEDLRTLHKLCRFSPTRSMYNVVAPPCWSEFQQAIRHKRNSSISNAESLTKTWRLQSDTTTWEEHIFEITLPTSMSLGHVDVYFTLQNSLNKPCVEVTLLRQTKSGIGHGKDVKFSVDETVTFDMLNKMENPVVCDEYLRSHNAEILAGPVNLAHYLDLTERSGTITLTSPKMFKLKVRNLLLHIRTVYDKDTKTKKSDSKETTILNKPTLPTFKSDHNLGCDYIHEISIGIYTPTDGLVPHEKTIRSLMLESNAFVQSLIMTVINSGNWEIVKNAMNILIWIASIRLVPNRSNNGDSPHQQLEFIFINCIDENMIGLLRRCLIKEDRNIAHKVASYIMTCYYGAKNIKPFDDHYDDNLLNALLLTLENVSDIQSSVGLHWLLSLILKLTQKNNEHLIIEKFVSLLKNVSENLVLKSNPYHRILRSRYGLYETPMEVELFDIDPPHFIKPSNHYVKPNFTFFSEGSHNITGISEIPQQTANNKEGVTHPKETSSGVENKHLFKNIACPKLVKGLIETEPLHFTCINTSEGTRLEMADSINPHMPSGMNNILPIIIGNAGKNEMLQKYLEKHLQVFHGHLADLFGDMDTNTNSKMQEAHFSMPMYYQDLQTTKAAIPVSEQGGYSKQPLPPIFTPSPQTIPNDCMQWQQLLLIPSKQEIVVERMHSGARRYVTLDFGDFISLTDILIPACSDLVSLTIDVWLFGEEIDAVRLVSAPDIGSKNLILTDLEPPPLCKFMKITVVGRYGMTTTRCRIPLGYFYGHLTVLSEDTPNEFSLKYADYEKQMCMLGKLMEDIICRYNLACSKLKDCLQLFLVADTKNSIYLSSCHNLFEDKLIIMPNSEHSKILAAYKETLTYQYQLNTIKNVMKRLESNFCKPEEAPSSASEETNLSANKLIIIAEGVLEVLLSLDTNADIDQEMCEQLFKGLCISETSRLQLLAAAFLEKSCGTSSFWGNFLADILVKLFSTSCTEIFPQDRLFILLVYLSRKSSERSIIIDAALRVIYETLKPLENNRSLLLAVNVDLSLLSWLLMYLSLQLSFEKVQNDRWDWVLGEMVGKVNATNMKNNGKKKSVKRVASTYGSSGCCILTPGQKNVETEIMDIVSSSISKQGLPKICIKSNNDNNEKPTKIKISKKNFLTGQSKVPQDGKDANGGLRDFINLPQKMPQFIDFTHCLAVSKILLKFIITMDHSGSADMMLLAFKIVSKLVTLAKVQLSYLLNENQLLELINFALSSTVPWAPFALSCFLQDVLECTCSNPTEPSSMDTSSPSTSVAWSINDSISGESEMNDTNSNTFMNIDEINEQIKPAKTNTNILGFPISLSSVTESDYSDFEELLDDYDRTKFQLANAKLAKAALNNLPGVSAAIDARLENAVNAPIEILLRKLVNRNSQKLMRTIANENAFKENESALSPWPINIGAFQQECNSSNHKMLQYCFDGLFKDMPTQTPERIENILHLWLTLNCARKDEKFDSSAIPVIPIKVESVCSLISTLAWVPGLTLTTWCLGFQALTLVCNTNNNVKNWFDISGMAHDIINHQDFIQMFLSFLSGNGITFFVKAVSGPTLCKALHDFIVRLQVRCDVVSPSSKSGSLLKSLLLQIVYQLVRPSGPISTRMGPLDAQCKIFQSIIFLDYSNIDISIGMSILESVSSLLNTYFMNADQFKCLTGIGDRPNSSNTFGDIFASVLGNDSNRQDRSVSYEDLLINLMRLLIRLIQIPMVPVHLENMDTTTTASTSQTDECKAEQIQQENSSLMPCFADTVLQHYPIVVCLCRCLAACKSSSLCMLSTLTPKVVFSNEPNTVVDAVFYMLTLLAKKSSKKELIMQPLLMFLSQASRISEPFFWFILQVLDNEEAIKSFLAAGGVSILASCVVSSSNTPSTISRSGIISTVMQHFTGFSAHAADQNQSILSSVTSKMYPPSSATVEEKSSLINFAPYCTITCQSGTSQPADVLIQGITGINHRRARTPLWSYNYYQEETHTELFLQLPSAILLKEVFLQPHAGGLATCPSYVAIETSASGPSRLVPACHPLPTSGLTSIRIHLPTAKVVNCILIRLYKPRVGNSIGLLQIRVLGTFAFGKGFNQNSEVEDESYCNHSLGWLRLLHHCFTLPADQQLRRQLVECASQVPKILNSCCGLLLVPSHIAPVFLPCLERVLRELALFSAENGATIIRILLDNRLTMLEPAISLDTLWQNRQTLSISGYQLACELLYQISVYQDENTIIRVKMLLDWLENVVKEYLQTGHIEECNASYILSITSILWFSNQSGVTYDLKSLITQEFFDQIYNVKMRTVKTNLKYAFNSLLCSLCYIHPEFFPLLLKKMDIFITNLSPISGSSLMCDDYKDAEGMTDDHKQGFANIELHHYLNTGPLNLSKDQLETLALASRSPSAMQQLLDSGLPKLLNNTINEFCNHSEDNPLPMAKLEKVIAILQFFTDICDEKLMRDWLGSPDGSSFWPHLLHWLCKRPLFSSIIQSEVQLNLEEICIKFLSKCCLCHNANQTRLAKVLCEVISMQPNGIPGFLRRLILQLFLESEKLPVSIEADETLYKTSKMMQVHVPGHPAFKQVYNRTVLYLSTTTTLEDILEQHVFFNNSYKSETNPTKRPPLAKRNIFKDLFVKDLQELSVAAGVTAKDKRAKDLKNQSTAIPQLKKKRYTSEPFPIGDFTEGRLIKCLNYSDQALPLNLNLGQLLRLLESKGTANGWSYLNLTICQSKTASEDRTQYKEILQLIDKQQPINSALQIFSSLGGLALLAQHLPTVYPGTWRLPNAEKQSTESIDTEWITVDDCDLDDTYEDLDDSGTHNPPTVKANAPVSHIPPHSLQAFRMFLKLPGYAEVLLKDTKKALCLLRLMLGVTDDGEGGDIFQSPMAASLPTLPFEVLRLLYDSQPLCSDDGQFLRRTSISIGVTQLLLACLGILTHHSRSGNNDKDSQKDKHKDDRRFYWAKGTGFGTGSTQQSWNVEQALNKQKNEEEHIAVLLEVLSSFINPNDKSEEELSGNILPTEFVEYLSKSLLVAVISSYLRNDSVLDMARHIPLYKAVLKMLRALAVSSQLVDLLVQQKSKSKEPSVSYLLKNMNTCVDTYTNKLKIPQSKSTLIDEIEDVDQGGESLAKLLPDIQKTANLVAKVTAAMIEDSDSEKESLVETVISPEEQYLKVMKRLQFASYEMVEEQEDGTIKFVVSHHFSSLAKSTTGQCYPARVKRIAQETVTLSNSLPLSYSSSVFVRYDTSRLDVMKVLITGPADTPYANGCFELDVFFPPDYPISPMLINLETTGHRTVRFNPNLYNDGKVCLSVLNTWHGRPEEKWNSQTSSFLQVLVSIQSLILVSEPYFNEPGYERARGTLAGTANSKDYNLNICQATVRWAMIEQILNPCPCFKDVIHTHFYMKKKEILTQVENWIQEMETETKKERKNLRSAKKKPSLECFKKIYLQLQDQLSKLKPTAALAEETIDDPITDDASVGGGVGSGPNRTGKETEISRIMGNGDDDDDDEDEEDEDDADEETPETPTTPTNKLETDMELDSDLDKDMEKMVNDVCKW